MRRLTRQPLHEGYQLVTSIAPLTSKRQDFVELCDDCSLLGGPSNPDCSTSSHLKQSFATEKAQRAQNRIGVDTEDNRQVFGSRDLLSRQRLAICDCSSNLGGNLFMEQHGLTSVDACEIEFCRHCCIGRDPAWSQQGSCLGR